VFDAICNVKGWWQGVIKGVIIAAHLGSVK
jgi:hypothetical protein